MSTTLTFRCKVGRDWSHMPLRIFRGMTAEEAWRTCDGAEVVAEYAVDGTPKGYVCGTEKWVEFYRAKGFTCHRFSSAADWLRERFPDLLESICPDVVDVFEGAELVCLKDLDKEGPPATKSATGGPGV